MVVADGTLSRLRDDQARRDVAYPWARCGSSPRIASAGSTGTDADGVPLASLFWSLPARRLEAFRARDLDAWKADVLAQCLPESFARHALTVSSSA